jgi:hypothetical protein
MLYIIKRKHEVCGKSFPNLQLNKNKKFNPYALSLDPMLQTIYEVVFSYVLTFK